MLNPFNQTSLYGLNAYFDDLKYLYNKDKFPNKILLSGPKGTGKSTLALHFINYVLSKNEDFIYDTKNFKISKKNRSFNLIKNNISPNFYLIDIKKDKKNIEINQIRELINFCNKSSLNDKPRFILIDNIELMNLNSSNSLLKILEEPNSGIYFILINSSKKILSTINSRCLNFRITLPHKEHVEIFNTIMKIDIHNLINKDLISHYFTIGDIIELYEFATKNDLDLKKTDLKNFLLKIIDNNYYKNDTSVSKLIYVFIQMFFLENVNTKGNYEFYANFINSINNIKKFNLDIESLFIQFRNQLINE
mgnify:CR=1 FL=1